jgi:hypothetical protein
MSSRPTLVVAGSFKRSMTDYQPDNMDLQLAGRVDDPLGTEMRNPSEDVVDRGREDEASFERT